MHLMDTLDGLQDCFRCFEVIEHVYPFYDQHIVFQLDLTSNIRGQSVVAGTNLTRFQRASEGAGQSTAGSSNDIVQGGRMWFADLRTHAIVLGDRPMNTETNRFFFSGQISKP